MLSGNAGNDLFLEMMNRLVMDEIVVLQRLRTLVDSEIDRYLARQHRFRQLDTFCHWAVGGKR